MLAARRCFSFGIQSGRLNVNRGNTVTTKRAFSYDHRRSSHRVPPNWLPQGVFGSIVKPTLFMVGVGGGVILWSEMVNDYSKDNKKSERTKTNLSQTSVFYDAVQYWKSIHPGTRTALSITAINTTVFLLWRLPPLQAFLSTHFMHSINSKWAHTLLTCSFSHITPLHLFLNSYILLGASHTTYDKLGFERFAALYICSGLFGIWFSHIYKLIRGIQAATIGASASVVGVMSAACLLKDDLKLSVIFFPFVSFSAYKTLPFWAGMEAAMMLFWKASPLDHAAHLGGMGFGYAYVTWLAHRKIVKKVTK